LFGSANFVGSRYDDLLVVDRLLLAQERLGDRLIGAVINDIPENQDQEGLDVLRTYLEHKGIPVLAMMPENRILRSVSVSELTNQLEANVLYSPSNIDLGDLMVEDLKIGAMDVSSAQLFFRNSLTRRWLLVAIALIFNWRRWKLQPIA
jgi:BioD-like phosphotransacetylase family protein